MSVSITKIYGIWPVLAVVCVLINASAAVANEKKLYRYHNAEGVLVIDFKIPPQYVEKGYDVISPSGQLILHVPPLTERQNKDDSGAVNSQRADDHYLLRSYSSVAEVKAAGDRKLRQLQNEILVIEKNLNDIRQLREEEQKRAANMQRGGREVSKALLKQIELLGQQEQDILKMLEMRRQEYSDVEIRYQSYAERYRVLTQSSPKAAPEDQNRP